MNTNELIEFLANSDKTAEDLLKELNPNLDILPDLKDGDSYS